MIQIYSKENTNYEQNGDMTLFPASCTLAAKLNDTWEFQLSHPVDDEGRWKYIEEEAVVSAPTFQGAGQLFRITEVEKTDTEIAATAFPIFFDSAKDCFIIDTRPENKNGQQALDIMTAGTKYSGQSDITTASTAYFVRRNMMDAINGEDEPTFIQRWGGEILYDNFKVIINQRVGGDYGTEVRYGKNMNGISYHVDMTDVVTRIVPVAYNGRMLYGEKPWVDAPNIAKYARIYIKEMKFEDVKLAEDVEGEGNVEDIICETIDELYEALRKKCEDQFSLGVDLPAATIQVNLADLSATEEYKDYKLLENASLGDTVHCRHSGLDITTNARVIELEWDCTQNIPAGMKLGDFDFNYFSELTSTLQAVEKVIRPGNTVMAERVHGVLNAINTQLRYQKSIAQRQDVRAILFEDTKPDSSTYGAMCLGTQGFQIADRRTQDNRDWDWTTAFTARGGYADVLVAGLLSDKTGKSFWNLDTGEMQLSGSFRQFASNGRKSIDISSNEIKVYAWNDNGNYTGSLGALKGTGKEEKRVGIGLWSDSEDITWIGYKDPLTVGNIKTVFKFDPKNIENGIPPYIVNTVSGNPSLISSLAWDGNGRITRIDTVRFNIENGLIKNWTTGTQNF